MAFPWFYPPSFTMFYPIQLWPWLLVTTGYFNGIMYTFCKWSDLLVRITGISSHNCNFQVWTCPIISKKNMINIKKIGKPWMGTSLPNNVRALISMVKRGKFEKFHEISIQLAVWSQECPRPLHHSRQLASTLPAKKLSSQRTLGPDDATHPIIRPWTYRNM